VNLKIWLNCYKRIKKLETKIDEYTKENISLQTQVTIVTQEKCEFENMAKLLQKEKSLVTSEKNDLEILLHESEANRKALQEQNEELAKIGSTYHSQREEQQQYFIQKETNLKLQSKFEHAAALAEITKLKKELASITDNRNIIKDELELIKKERDILLEEKYERKIEQTSLLSRLKNLEKNIEVEQETVKILSEKNCQLTSDLAKLNVDLQNSYHTNLNRQGGQLTNDEKDQIDELLKSKIQNQIEENKMFNEQIVKLNQEVTCLETKLRIEQQQRFIAENRNELFENEVEKLKSESEMALSLASFSNKPSKSSKLHTLPFLYNYIPSKYNNSKTRLNSIRSDISSIVDPLESDSPSRSDTDSKSN